MKLTVLDEVTSTNEVVERTRCARERPRASSCALGAS